MTPAQKAVLISLADNASDEGVCWPSINTIAKRTCLSERAVRGAVRWLESAGLLRTDHRKGRASCYIITPENYLYRHGPEQEDTPADAAALQEMPPSETPAGNAAPPADAAAHPGSSCPQNRKRTVKEPSEKNTAPVGDGDATSSKRKKFTLPQMLADNPHGLPEDLLADWLATRKAKMTETAWRYLNRELDKCVAAGISPLAAATEMVSREWRSLKAEWLVKQREKNAGGNGRFHPLESIQRKREEYFRQQGIQHGKEPTSSNDGRTIDGEAFRLD